MSSALLQLTPVGHAAAIAAIQRYAPHLVGGKVAWDWAVTMVCGGVPWRMTMPSLPRVSIWPLSYLVLFLSSWQFPSSYNEERLDIARRYEQVKGVKRTVVSKSYTGCLFL